MKTLFEVNIRLYVVAEDEREAKYEATKVSDPDSCDVEVMEAETVDSVWANAIPFGGEDDRKCKEYLSVTRKLKKHKEGA